MKSSVLKLSLFWVWLLAAISVAFSQNTFYLYANQVFSPEQDASVQFYDYSYRQTNHNVQVAIYKSKKPKHFFQTYLAKPQNGQHVINDSALQQLDYVKNVTVNFNQYYNTINLGKLDEGVYIVEAIYERKIAQVPLIVNNIGLVTQNLGSNMVLYAANKKSGTALNDFKAVLFREGRELEARNYKDGIAYFDFGGSEPARQYYGYAPMMVYDTKGNVAVNQIYFNYYYQPFNKTYKTYVLTDRSVYRPTQTVKFKASLRKESDKGYEVFTDSVQYRIVDPQNKEIVKKTVKLNEDGAFDDSLLTDEKFALGTYHIYAKRNNEPQNPYQYYYAQQDQGYTFAIEEYKKPEYEVTVKLDKSQYSIGDKISAKISGKYFFGSPVTNADVVYKVMRQEYHAPVRYRGYYSWWYDDYYSHYYGNYQQEIVKTGTLKLDKDGFCTVEVPTEATQNRNCTYTVIAEVTDASRRMISNSSNAMVTYSEYVISAYTDKYYYNPKEKMTLTANASDYSGNPVKTSLTADVYRYDYKNWWVTSTRKIKVTTLDAKTNETTGDAIFTFEADSAGYYSIETSGNDSRKHKVSYNLNSYVMSKNSGYFGWWQQNRGGVQVVTDKKVYEAGDKVKAMVYVPQEMDAMMTVTNEYTGWYETFRFKGSNESQGKQESEGANQEIELPLNEYLTGKLNVSLVGIKGGSMFQQHTEITVIPKQQYLNVEVIFDKDTYKPTTEAMATVRVTDYLGRPVPNADIALATIDESIFAMNPDATPDIAKFFYGAKSQHQPPVYQNYYYSSVHYAQALTASNIELRNKKMGAGFMRAGYLDSAENYRVNYEKLGNNNARLSGYVLDNKTGVPLTNAILTIGNHSFGTDQNGYYEVTGLLTSIHSVNATLTTSTGLSVTLTQIPLREHHRTTLNIGVTKNTTYTLSDKTVTQTDYFGDLKNGQNGVKGTGILSGTVSDESSKEPISFATVALYKDNKAVHSVASDTEGKYSFKSVEAGKYTLKVRYVGYKDLTMDNVVVEAGMTKNIALKMKGEVQSLDAVNVVADVEEVVSRNQVGSVSLPKAEMKVMEKGFDGRKSSGKNTNSPTLAGELMDDNLSAEKPLVEAKVRNDFKDAIYWNPGLKTNNNGEAKIKIKLPDNLTTWRTTARVITKDTKVGQCVTKITVRKNLLVRMETPRFLTLGDELLIATNIHNYLSSEKSVKVALMADGVQVNGTERWIKVKANGEERIDWKVSAPWLQKAKLTVKALTDEESDAMALDVPVLPYGLEMVKSQSINVGEDNPNATMSYMLPENTSLAAAQLQLSVDPSMTSALLNGIENLIGYPYGCVEQTMSRFLPNVIVSNTLENLGNNTYTSAVNKEELAKMVAAGIKRLGELQHTDGGWGWWTNDATHPFMTAYVCNGMYLAKKAGHPIPDNMYKGGVNALRELVLNRKSDDPSTHAYQMVVAMQYGMKEVWEKYKTTASDKDNAYTLALWLQAATLAKDNEMKNKMLKLLENNVQNAGGACFWGGKKFYYSWQDDQVETTANAIKAIYMADPNHKLLVPATRWLMSKREGDAWHNTRQTAMSIYALNNFIKAELNADYSLELVVNGKIVQNMSINPGTSTKKSTVITIKDLKAGENTIVVRMTGKGNPMISTKLTYFHEEPKKGSHPDRIIEKTENEKFFNVSREYFKLVKKVDASGKLTYTKEKVSLENIKSGDEILVKSKVSVTSAQDFVLIEDPIPAGCEFIRDTKGFIIPTEKEYDGITNYWETIGYNYYNWNRWYTHREYRDSKLAMTITKLNTGTYEYSYLLRAQIPGNYRVTPAIAQLMYYPEFRGYSNFEEMTIKE